MNSVSNILRINFSNISLEEKVKIKTLGRPLPDLNLTQRCEKKRENRTFTRRFNKNIYRKNTWICGCDVTNLLYCFPCTLFYTAGMDMNWARSGIKDLKHLLEKIGKHEMSCDHVNACISLALLGTTNPIMELNSEYRHNILKHNENVRKNRYILKRMISCIKFSSAFETALRGHNATESLANRGIFKELVDFSAELDSVLKEHLQSASVFKGTSKAIQNDLLDCMLAVCREEIAHQIDESDYLSIQCDETADVSNLCQMVLIFRYVYKGSVFENFWGFLKVTDKTADGLKSCIETEIDPLILKCPHKLISQTYDGANVMSASVNSVQTKIREKYRYAYFVHCYAHKLNLILQKAASQNPKVRMFFNNLSAIPRFFSNSSHWCDVLEEIVQAKLPEVAVTRWNYNIRTVNIVYENRKKLIEVFQEIEDKCTKNVTSKEAYGLRMALQDPEFMFWLTLFHKVLPHVDVLYKQVQSDKGSVQLQNDISTFEKSISSIKSKIQNIYERSEVHNPKRRKLDVDTQSVIAEDVCDTIISQMKVRFSHRGHLQADHLFNNDSFETFSTAFPREIFNTVISFYPMLSKDKLKTELEVLYMRTDFRKITGTITILSFILGNNLSETFNETVKLLKIILTTPVTTAESGRCFSTSKRIETYLHNTMTNHHLDAFAMMSINKDLVHEIENFEDKVIEKFISVKERRMDFTLKK